MPQDGLNIRLPKSEIHILESYCRTHSRTKTEVIREFIRSLEQESLQPPPQQLPQQSRPLPVSSDDWHQVALAWQQLALANFQLCCQLSASKLFFQADFTFELDSLKRLVLFWLDLQEVSFDQKRALIQLFADILSLEEVRQYLDSN